MGQDWATSGAGSGHALHTCRHMSMPSSCRYDRAIATAFTAWLTLWSPTAFSCRWHPYNEQTKAITRDGNAHLP
jgi:hypothetical protein